MSSLLEKTLQTLVRLCKILKSLCDRFHCVYVDIAERFKLGEGSDKDKFMSDMLHINNKGSVHIMTFLSVMGYYKMGSEIVRN